jgi:hypothetical protein
VTGIHGPSGESDSIKLFTGKMHWWLGGPARRGWDFSLLEVQRGSVKCLEIVDDANEARS